MSLNLGNQNLVGVFPNVRNTPNSGTELKVAFQELEGHVTVFVGNPKMAAFLEP